MRIDGNDGVTKNTGIVLSPTKNLSFNTGRME